jgi:hypothetical protein
MFFTYFLGPKFDYAEFKNFLCGAGNFFRYVGYLLIVTKNYISGFNWVFDLRGVIGFDFWALNFLFRLQDYHPYSDCRPMLLSIRRECARGGDFFETACD